MRVSRWKIRQLQLTEWNLLATVAVVAVSDGVIAAVNVAAAVPVLRGHFAVTSDVQAAVAIMDDAAVASAERKPLDAQSPVFIWKSTKRIVFKLQIMSCCNSYMCSYFKCKLIHFI